MTSRIAAIMALLVLTAACGGEEAGPSSAGVDAGSSEQTLPAAASVDLSDPDRNQALDDLDAILAADEGPEPVMLHTTPETGEAAAVVPSEPAPVDDLPAAATTPPAPNPDPEPSFTPDAPAPAGPVVLAQDRGVTITAEPVGVLLLRVGQDRPAVAHWPGRSSGEAFMTHVVHDRFAAAEIELIDAETAAPVPADGYSITAADGWVILVEGPIAGHSYEPTDEFVMTRSVSDVGTEGWFVAGDSRGASLFVFPTTDGPPVRADLDLLL